MLETIGRQCARLLHSPCLSQRIALARSSLLPQQLKYEFLARQSSSSVLNKDTSYRTNDSISGGGKLLGTRQRLPEFSLANKIILVSGAARGVGLAQSEALLEAGATGKCPFTVVQA